MKNQFLYLLTAQKKSNKPNMCGFNPVAMNVSQEVINMLREII